MPQGEICPDAARRSYPAHRHRLAFRASRDDPGMFMKYVRTTVQMADMMTKASFTSLQWRALCTLCSLGPSMMTCAAKRKLVLPKRRSPTFLQQHQDFRSHFIMFMDKQAFCRGTCRKVIERGPLSPTINVSKQTRTETSQIVLTRYCSSISSPAAAADSSNLFNRTLSTHLINDSTSCFTSFSPQQQQFGD